jgi:hypothetical protein
MSPSQRFKEQRIAPYAMRNAILRDLGFPSYKAYLKSDLWYSIRKTLFSAKGHNCHLCQKYASQVHHSAYDRDTLRGKCLDHLHPICRKCHKAIEFPFGYKGSIQTANRFMFA